LEKKPRIDRRSPKENQDCSENTEEETDSTSERMTVSVDGEHGNHPDLSRGKPVMVEQRY
jgi:hypothetical protein